DGEKFVTASGENYWPPPGKSNWPLTGECGERRSSISFETIGGLNESYRGDLLEIMCARVGAVAGSQAVGKRQVSLYEPVSQRSPDATVCRGELCESPATCRITAGAAVWRILSSSWLTVKSGVRVAMSAIRLGEDNALRLSALANGRVHVASRCRWAPSTPTLQVVCGGHLPNV
ncbi:hypothetical protein PQF33_51365, partial [Dactylosporangium aurantiacum]